ncbi:hypothetical protein [Nocardia sp. NPDC024068]|uniref:hypothetical protein n=1 Tax=Nocardia sp. NPDC024068 TaxID=3157197 RepID=UPI0033C14E5E
MKTAFSPTRTGTWEDADARENPVPIPPGETGTGYQGDGGLPVPAPPRRPVPGPCTAAVPGAAERGVRRAVPVRDPVPRRGPAVDPHPRHPSPDEWVERARAGWAAVASTALITAAVVVVFLAMAHLRAPEPPAPAPIPSGIPAAAVPPGESGAPWSR